MPLGKAGRTGFSSPPSWKLNTRLLQTQKAKRMNISAQGQGRSLEVMSPFASLFHMELPSRVIFFFHFHMDDGRGSLKMRRWCCDDTAGTE